MSFELELDDSCAFCLKQAPENRIDYRQAPEVSWNVLIKALEDHVRLDSGEAETLSFGLTQGEWLADEQQYMEEQAQGHIS